MSKYLDTKKDSLEQSILGVWEEAAKKQEKLDPVGKEDGDIDNDGDKDSTDKYLAKRRKAISKAIKKDKKEEVELDEASVTVDLENDNKKLMSDIKKMGIKVKDLGDSGNPGYNEYKLTGSPAALKKGGKKFGWDQQVEKVKVKEGKMSQLHQLMKDGKTAEEIAKIMRVDAKTIKKLMAGHMKDMKEYYEIGTDEYRKHTEDVTPGENGDWAKHVGEKSQSMREALAKVWGVSEGKSPFKKEEKKSLKKEVKDDKTMTGKKIAKVDINPTIKEKAK